MAVLKNLQYPFGFDQGDPLVVCRNIAHMREVQKAFHMKAYYVSGWNSSLLGHQFGKIVVFHPGPLSDLESRNFQDWYRHYLPTKLSSPDGKIYFI